MFVIGIDPGFAGAIAVLNNGKIVSCIDMPILKIGKKNILDEQKIVKFIEEIGTKNSSAFIEKAQSMPGQGIVSTANYMAGYGILRGICAGLRISYTLVHPKTWKSKLMRDLGKEKGASIVRVKQLFPDFDLPRKKDHGKADAILIAKWGEFFCKP